MFMHNGVQIDTWPDLGWKDMHVCAWRCHIFVLCSETI